MTSEKNISIKLEPDKAFNTIIHSTIELKWKLENLDWLKTKVKAWRTGWGHNLQLAIIVSRNKDDNTHISIISNKEKHISEILDKFYDYMNNELETVDLNYLIKHGKDLYSWGFLMNKSLKIILNDNEKVIRADLGCEYWGESIHISGIGLGGGLGIPIGRIGVGVGIGGFSGNQEKKDAPETVGLLVCTTARLLFISPSDVHASIPLDRIVSISVEKELFVRKVILGINLDTHVTRVGIELASKNEDDYQELADYIAMLVSQIRKS